MTHTVELSALAPSDRVGGKALGLRWLADHGHRVPATWILTPPITEPIVLPSSVSPHTRYAVRSSANVEDGGSTSYAGQFTSILDVQGHAAIREAIQAVAESAHAVGVASYREHQHDDREVEMSIIVQEMVPPQVSGVAFSRNPITGIGETVVEAVEGSGDRLQAEGMTPHRWIHRWGDLVSAPDLAILPGDVVEDIVHTVGRIADDYGAPVDVEWVFDGEQLWWVQVREITGLDDVTIYSRRIAREVLPGMIKPLVWSINVPMVNRAWLDLLEEAIGSLDIEAEDLAHPFAYRAYFNMTAFGEVFAALGMPRESLELLLGLPAGSDQPSFSPTTTTIAKTPRILGLGLRHVGYGRHVDAEVERLTTEYRRIAARDLSAATDEELVADIDHLRVIGVEAARINVVTPLLANAYAALLRRQLHSTNVDSTDAMAAATGAAYDPNPHLDALATRIASLDDQQRAEIIEKGYGALDGDLKSEFDRFFDEFGHFSDSGNDFSIAPWSESPDLVVRLAAERPTTERTPSSRIEGTVPVWRYPLVRGLLRKTGEYGHRRDAVSSMYTYGYGLFRYRFLELGGRLVDRGILSTPDDIMYLRYEEVLDALSGGAARHDDVTRRRAEMADLEDIDMPDLIYGKDFVAVRPDSDASVWTGTPTARGSHRGTARIVKGIEDFGKVEDGDVIVIPFSDVGWTPLFAKAGGVVAESGGMLSHSSIVAREYGLPCVVSVSGALRIPDGSIVVVDGYRGTVTMEQDS